MLIIKKRTQSTLHIGKESYRVNAAQLHGIDIPI